MSNPTSNIFAGVTHPVIGMVHLQALPGQTIRLDAGATTDPDGDRVDIRWYTYPEAGIYDGQVTILDSEQAQASVAIPTDAAGKQIHVILEVKDLNPIASLYDYRRIVIDVTSIPMTSKILYRDEFEADYISMIEHFRKLESKPRILICCPVPTVC